MMCLKSRTNTPTLASSQLKPAVKRICDATISGRNSTVGCTVPSENTEATNKIPSATSSLSKDEITRTSGRISRGKTTRFTRFGDSRITVVERDRHSDKQLQGNN